MKSAVKIAFLCSECGGDFPKWHGQCPACKEWGTLSEFKVTKKTNKFFDGESRKPTSLNEILYDRPEIRIPTKITEVDRVLGGGMLKGSVILLGGSPGIGKSTLALQIVSGCDITSLYVSAEESESQIGMRAKRLKVSSDKLQISAENQIEKIRDYVSLIKPELIIIDSIQTMFTPGIDSLPGSPNQIRECGQQLLQLSKQRELTVIIIGHVTKDGIIAGPKMLEHMVDTVLYLEGDDRYDHRILRCVKNRFGATHEVGIFLMSSKGLQEVKNPSELFLEERTKNVAGTAIYASLEGTRPILVEVQALVSPANFGTPQRNVNGFDFKRLSMLLAVLEKRMNVIMGTKDVFVNLVGGLKINDPAADLSIISTVASSSREKPIDPSTVLIGEVGLAGEVRSVSQIEKRIQEAKTLGFTIVIVPKSNERTLKPRPKGISIEFVSTVKDTFNILF